jgi:hypothetical protein
MSSNILDEAFNVDEEEGSPPRELLPPGKFTAEIQEATVAPTKNGQGQMVKLRWHVVEGEHAKRVVFQQILIQHSSPEAQRFGRGRFKDVCASCGITGAITDLNDLLFKACTITVGVRKDKTGEYSDQNQITNVLPYRGPAVATSVGKPGPADVGIGPHVTTDNLF